MTQTRRTRYSVANGTLSRQGVVYVEPVLSGESDDTCAARLAHDYAERYCIRDGLDIEVATTHNGRRVAYVTVEASHERPG